MKAKKVLAMLMASAMIMGTAVTAFAADGRPEATDRATVKISNLSGNPTVTLYQIAEVQYGPGNVEFVDYEWADGIDAETEITPETNITPAAPTATEINAIAQNINKENGITPIDTIVENELPEGEGVNGNVYTATVPAGAYIAIITGASDDTIYNPILLTATYGTEGNEGNLVGGNIDATSSYLYGSTAIAKSTTPDIDKEIKEGTTADDERETASVGDVITYELTPTIPDYPSNATNKTFYITDTLSAGLTFDYSSLTVNIAGQTVTRDGNDFKLGDVIIATAHKTDNGFNLSFDYEKLVFNNETGAVYQPTVTYDAVVNEKAVVGDDGNGNIVILYYGNPNEGNTYKNVETIPDKATGVESITDQETVYTYQLAFMKVDDSENEKPLAGAVFGIYSDESCTTLIDKVTTNEDGYAVSTNVAAGTYYVKELVAPTGYSLNDKVYKIKASWETATTTVTGTVTDRTYTTENPSGDAVQVGWIKDSVFYAMDEVNKENAEANGYQPAYLDSENTTTATDIEITTNSSGGGTAMLDTAIPNTSLSTLPSTGGIGTTVFTIGGCVIMVTAAGLYFATRKKEHNA